jgi:hypothetical protein
VLKVRQRSQRRSVVSEATLIDCGEVQDLATRGQVRIEACDRGQRRLVCLSFGHCADVRQLHGIVTGLQLRPPRFIAISLLRANQD